MKNKISEIIINSLNTENTSLSANHISAAVIDKDNIICGAFTKNGHNENRINEKSRFLMYSLTKTLIAICIMKIINSGVMSLDDKLDRWFPQLKNGGRISVFNCLRHTGGLPDYGGLREYHDAVKSGGAPWTFDEFLNRTIKNELLFTPGDKFAYSNIGYMLLKRIIELERGITFSEVLQKDIFNTLSLKSTEIIEKKEDLLKAVLGSSSYLGSKELPADVYKNYHPDWVSHGLAASTAYETALIYNSLFSGKLLPENMLELMTSAFPVSGVTGRPFYNPGYGLGLMIDDSPHGKICGHTGGGPGSSAACYHLSNQSNSITIAIFTDSEDAVQAERIIYEIFKLR